MTMPEQEFDLVKAHDLGVLIQPYVFIGAVIIILAVAVRMVKMPMDGDTHATQGILSSLREIVRVRNYREGVVAQFFYVGAQVTCWTFIIQYGTRVFMEEGLDERGAEMLSQKYNIAALVLFTCSRFICTWFLKYVQPGRLLEVLAVVAAALAGGVILLTGRSGLYCLVGVSGCMSLMFPTIYGIALHGLGDRVKVGGAGLIMAILGGSVFTPLQAAIIDTHATVLGLPATNVSFIVPLVCFTVVAAYGHRAFARQNIAHE